MKSILIFPILIALVAIASMVIAKVFSAKIPEPPQNLTDADIRNAALQGQKIQAIKWYRQLHGVGLKDAKDAVEKMARGY